MNSKQKTKLSLVNEIIREWSLSCTFHCYPKLFQYKNIPIKLVWFTLFVTFTAFTAFLVYKSLIDYFQYEVVSKIEVINVEELDFPTVTICEMSLFTSKEAETYMEFMWKNITGKDMNDLNEEERIKFGTLSAYIQFAAASLSDSQKSKFGLGQKNFLSCLFNLKECNLTNDFRWFYSTDLGNCLQFNTKSPFKKSILQGNLNGLSLGIGPFQNSNKRLASFANGLRIFIRDDRNEPTLFDEAIYVDNKKLTKISLKKAVSYNQPKPYTNCDDINALKYKSDLVKFFEDTSKAYKQQDCLSLCIQRLVNEKCECNYVGWPIFKTLRSCSNLKDFDCYKKISIHFVTNTKSFKAECLKECPLECESVVYDTEISSIEYESNERLYVDHNNASQSFNNAYLDIYFSSMKYTEIIQTPKINIIDLISNLGGVLGIFLGFSVFSLIEIVEVAAQVMGVLLNGENLIHAQR
jgi:hypothetical protein